MLTYDYFVLYFITYAFLGWVWELVFIRLTEHRWHLHGFLTIPILPIYGFSAIGMILFIRPYVENPFLVFVASVALVTVMELVTGFVLKTAFHIRLWDYEAWPYNFHGYVSLFSSLGFGVMGLFLLYVVQPWVAENITSLSTTAVFWLGTILTIVFAIDFANSLWALVKVRLENARGGRSLDEIQHTLAARLKAVGESPGFQHPLMAWNQRNVRHLRAAFPEARMTTEKKRPVTPLGKAPGGTAA